MATQLGMVRFTPLVCARSVVTPGAHSAERWRRVCLEACKQSRRFYLPEIEAPASPRELARRAAPGALWVAHPAAEPSALFAASSLPNTLTILIGPEGGFTEQEVGEVLAAGGRAFGLGAAILRIETAAVAALAAVTFGARQGI
jgi:16S rRNA (uracil1498-N3)-methyltransferase